MLGEAPPLVHASSSEDTGAGGSARTAEQTEHA
jgi:hypothetical protein